MGLVVYQVQLSFSIHPMIDFVLLVGLGVVVYALAVLLLDRQFDWGVTYHLRRMVANVRR
jgi:hypothetical protein